MKNILKKFHFGSNHESNRSNEISSQSPITALSGDHRTPSVSDSALSPSSPSMSTVTTTNLPSTSSFSAKNPDRSDYFSSEEDYQVQLALAISASNNEFKEETKRRNNSEKVESECSSDAQSRRYWEYNVLDYDERVLDGFYDIYGPSSPAKIPSLIDLQSNSDGLGYEVVIVNRSIDVSLEELEQVACCIALDCPSGEVKLLVQRIADLITDHMGGPVKDANDILARWIEKNTELRTTLQTNILPIGCLSVGLSRHRALLFKVLADKVGIPCRLVKGSHYTGIDDDAINMIKLECDREFLVDLMAAPGTLIPSDILSTMDVSSTSYNSRPSKNSTPWLTPDPSAGSSKMSPLHGEFPIGKSSSEKTASVPSSSVNTGSQPIAIKSDQTEKSKSMIPSNESYHFSSSIKASRDKVNQDVYEIGADSRKDTVEAKDLFLDLNPFQIIGSGTGLVRNKEFQRQRDISSGPGRPPVAMKGKNRPFFNEVPRTKQYDFVEGLFPKNKAEHKDSFSSSLISSHPISYEKPINGISNVTIAEKRCIPLVNVGRPSRPVNSPEMEAQSDKQAIEVLHIASDSKESIRSNEQNCDIKNLIGDKFLNNKRILGNEQKSCFPADSGPSRLDPMLDDVAEWEIPWEDLVIGERIGLGSYGEVYRADWNGTEVAVKKFLDQDFSGDALEEFRSEVRIMRRLRHPNVVCFMGAVTRPPNLSIVSEFLPRGSLYRILHRPNCQIDEKRRLKMALDVVKGMNCLHTSTPTIVHRDLKSPNLLVDNDWNVKVCDFGLSRLKHNTFLSSKSTAGTPEWMAPEVLRNEPSNEKCDVYSFGVILWELATLKMPWSGMNPMQVVGAVGFQHRRLEIPKEVDPLVARIILECWQMDPNSRPSFAQLISALMPLQQLIVSQ